MELVLQKDVFWLLKIKSKRMNLFYVKRIRMYSLLYLKPINKAYTRTNMLVYTHKKRDEYIFPYETVI